MLPITMRASGTGIALALEIRPLGALGYLWRVYHSSRPNQTLREGTAQTLFESEYLGRDAMKLLLVTLARADGVTSSTRPETK